MNLCEKASPLPPKSVHGLYSFIVKRGNTSVFSPNPNIWVRNLETCVSIILFAFKTKK